MKKTTTNDIFALLPQTQCQKCGYACCRDYAKAIADGAPINRCPTGGEKGVLRLSRLTGRPCFPLDPQYGKARPRNIAVIDESQCIGCRLCIKACPVDAIIGTNGFTHTVLSPKCTGCDLCLPVCPVDCIHMKNASGDKTGWDAWSPAQAKRARIHYELRQERLKYEKKKENQRLRALTDTDNTRQKKQHTVLAAIEKARAAKAKSSSENISRS